ncbi:MAG: hypothetical protein MHM6MM_001789 [Cercozoa sp. M6MM]
MEDEPGQAPDVCAEGKDVFGRSAPGPSFVRYADGLFRDLNDSLTVLFAHGNAEDLRQVDRYISFAEQYRCNVLCFDYTGYGLQRADRTTQHALYENAEAAWRFLTETKGIRPDRIVLVGRSLGSGVVMHLAEQHPDIAGVILITPLLSIGHVVPACAWCCHCLHDWFPTHLRLSRINTVKVLVLHGDRDRVVPHSHGRTIVETLRSQLHRQQAERPLELLVTIQGAGHNDVDTRNVSKYCNAVAAFLTAVTPDDLFNELDVDQMEAARARNFADFVALHTALMSVVIWQRRLLQRRRGSECLRIASEIVRVDHNDVRIESRSELSAGTSNIDDRSESSSIAVKVNNVDDEFFQIETDLLPAVRLRVMSFRV